MIFLLFKGRNTRHESVKNASNLLFDAFFTPFIVHFYTLMVYSLCFAGNND